MSIEQFRRALRARPVRPFRIHIADQQIIPVNHPEAAFQTEGGRTVVVNTSGENTEIFDVLLVTRLTFEDGDNGGTSKRPNRKKKS